MYVVTTRSVRFRLLLRSAVGAGATEGGWVGDVGVPVDRTRNKPVRSCIRGLHQLKRRAAGR